MIFWNARRRDNSQSLRHRQTEKRLGKRVFRVAAGADESAYVVAFPWRAHAFPTRDPPARDFEARNGALARRRRIDTFPLQAIGTIDARGGNFDQDLAGPRFRERAPRRSLLRRGRQGLRNAPAASSACIFRFAVPKTGNAALSRRF